MDSECQAESGAEAESNPLAWSVPLRVDEEADEFLSRSQINTAEEEQIPREVISEALGAARFQAELSRPLFIGTLRDVPAYLLKTRFSFGRVTTNWLSRIQAADITILFEDAPTAGVSETVYLQAYGADHAQLSRLNFGAGKGSEHPTVAAYYPENFEGDITPGSRTITAEAALNATYLGAGASLTLGQSTTRDVEGKVVVHGMRRGRQRNAITWSIEEDLIAKGGIPRTVELPLIVTRESQGRFSARVTVKAHYGFWRGALARGIPVLGKDDSPLFFDPVSLDSIATTGKSKAPDGRLIVEKAGAFDDLDLSKYSTFTATRLE